MPNEQNSISINFLVDEKTASEALKILRDINKNVEGLKISFEGLDKQASSSFEKLISSISSSRTQDAIKYVSQLNTAVRDLNSAIAGGKLGGGFDVPEDFRSVLSGFGAMPTVAGGGAIGGGGGGKLGGGYDTQESSKIGISGAVLGQLPGFDFSAAAFKNVLGSAGLGGIGGALTGAITLAAVPVITKEISNLFQSYKTIEERSQAAILQTERRPYREAMSGDITLQFLKSRGIGLAAEAEKVFQKDKYLGFEYGQAALQTEGFFSTAFLQYILGYKGEALKGAAAKYVGQMQNIDIAQYGEMGKFLGLEQGLYRPFARTFDLYGYGATKNILTGYQKSGRTQEEALAAQQYAAAAGLGLADINIQNTALARRFGFSGTAEQAVAIFGDPRTTGTRDSLFSAVGTMMGGPVGGAGTEIFSELAAKRMMQFMSQGNVQVSQVEAPYTAAAAYIDATGLKSPARQAAQQQRVAEYLESQTARGGISDIAGLKTIFNLGIRNQAQAEYVLDLFRRGRSDDAIKYLKKLGITTTVGELRKAEADILTPMMQAALAPYGDVTQMEVSPLTFATVKGGVGARKEAELIAGGTFGVEGEAPTQVKQRELGPATRIDLKVFEQIAESISAMKEDAVIDYLSKAFSQMSSDLVNQKSKLPSGSPSQFNGTKTSPKSTGTTNRNTGVKPKNRTGVPE